MSTFFVEVEGPFKCSGSMGEVQNRFIRLRTARLVCFIPTTNPSMLSPEDPRIADRYHHDSIVAKKTLSEVLLKDVACLGKTTDIKFYPFYWLFRLINKEDEPCNIVKPKDDEDNDDLKQAMKCEHSLRAQSMMDDCG